MNDTELDDSSDDRGGGLDQLMLEALPPIVPAEPSGSSLRRRLLERAAASAAASAGLRTTRSRDGSWKAILKGIRMKPLWQGPEGNSVLLELAPGASLPVHSHRFAEEGIVLRGHLQIGAIELGAGDYHFSPPGSHHAKIRSAHGALAYLRGTSLGETSGVLREILGGLLPWGRDQSQTVYAADAGDWIERAPGVAIKPLRSDGALCSYFCRVDAGTDIEGHVHDLDEECLMVDGDLFLGDVLLRKGDYQLAPAGTRHGRISSDVGALLFVRGQSS